MKWQTIIILSLFLLCTGISSAIDIGNITDRGTPPANTQFNINANCWLDR